MQDLSTDDELVSGLEILDDPEGQSVLIARLGSAA
jgi:hypothetical protein